MCSHNPELACALPHVINALPPHVYLDICRRYVGARLRDRRAYLEAEPLPHEHVARLASR